jgi:EpsI family protein
VAASPGLTRRTLIAGGVLVAATVATASVAPPSGGRITEVDLAAAIPREFAGWKMVENAGAIVPNPEDEANVTAAYEEAVSRTYVRADGRFVMMVVAHGRSDSGLLAIHRAEICYAAQGFAVDQVGQSRLAAPFEGLTGKRLVAVLDERREQVVYWATVAGEQSDVGIMQKLRLLKAAWEDKPLDAFLVRGSTIMPDNDAMAFALVDGFLKDLMNALPRPLLPLIGGRTI